MMHRIRLAMQRGTFDKISGDVEVDETFIGGKARFMHKCKRAAKIKGTGPMGKTAVMGLLERHGPDGHSRVRVKHVPNTRKKTLAPGSPRSTSSPARPSTPMRSRPTTGSPTPTRTKSSTTPRPTCAARSTPTGWRTSGRCSSVRIKGTYVCVEPFHLFRYLDEEAFRFNTRKAKDGARFLETLRGVVGKRLTYAELTGKDMLPATT